MHNNVVRCLEKGHHHPLVKNREGYMSVPSGAKNSLRSRLQWNPRNPQTPKLLFQVAQQVPINLVVNNAMCGSSFPFAEFVGAEALKYYIL